MKRDALRMYVMIQPGWLLMKPKRGFEPDYIWLLQYFDRDCFAPNVSSLIVSPYNQSGHDVYV